MTQLSINDYKYVALKAYGYDGSLNDMEYKYYKELLGVSRGSFSDLYTKFKNQILTDKTWETEIAYWTSLSSIHPRTAAYLAAMTVSPEPAVIEALNTFFVETEAILDRMDIAYFLASHDTQSRNINIIDPGSYTLTEYGSAPFIAYQGYQPPDFTGTSYLGTNFTASTHATKMVLNDAEMGVFVLTNDYDPGQSSPAECGGTYTLVKALEYTLISGEPTTVGGRVNRNATLRTLSGVVTNAVGLTSVRRDGPSTNGSQLYKNGVQLTTSGGASVQLDNVEWFIGKANDGSSTSRTNRKLGFFYAGLTLTLAQHLALYNAVRDYLTVVGAYDHSAALAPPNVGGADPYAPDAGTYVWTTAYAGTALDLTGYTLEKDYTFASVSEIAKSGTAAVSDWYAPVRTWTLTEGTFAQVDDAAEPFKMDSGDLKLRMYHDGTKWRGVHMQTSESDGSGYSQTKGYWECRMKTPVAGTYGAWPAFWLYGTQLYTDTDETRPEIDIVELYPGNDHNGHHSSVHLRPGNPYVLGRVSQHWVTSKYTKLIGLINDGNYHTYGAKVTDDWIIIYYDGSELKRIPTHPDFLQPLHTLVSLQLLSDELSSMNVSVPIDMWVDYVKIYQEP